MLFLAFHVLVLRAVVVLRFSLLWAFAWSCVVSCVVSCHSATITGVRSQRARFGSAFTNPYIFVSAGDLVLVSKEHLLWRRWGAL